MEEGQTIIPKRVRKPLQLTPEQHKRMEKYGKFPDNYPDVLDRLMNFADQHWDEYKKTLEDDQCQKQE